MHLRKTLNDIGLECGTDKSSGFHGYLDFYDDLLSTFRTQPISFLEIGVAGGESIRMWNEYFTHPLTKIYGVEIQDKPLPPFDERTQIFLTDATSPNAVFDIASRTGPLDVLLDDGSHLVEHQKTALRLWWSHIKPGGLFICEDLHSNFHFPWITEGQESFLDYMMTYIKDLMEHGLNQCGKPVRSDIEEIIIRKSVVVLKKRNL